VTYLSDGQYSSYVWLVGIARAMYQIDVIMLTNDITVNINRVSESNNIDTYLPYMLVHQLPHALNNSAGELHKSLMR